MKKDILILNRKHIDVRNDIRDKKMCYWRCCFSCFCILLLIACFFTSVSLSKAFSKTYALNTTGYKYELFNLSTTEPIMVQIKAGNRMLKVYNISSNDTEEFVRGLYLKRLDTSNVFHNAYFCSRDHGIQNANSICGSYRYEKL